jgi:hypothetical protein
MGWRPIKEELILHRWQCFCASPETITAEVPPYWYAEHGTPVCADCGEDMEYIETLLDCKFDPMRETLVISIKEERQKNAS